MELANTDLTTWNTQDLKGSLLKLKLKATGTKPELINRVQIFEENNELLEKQLKEVNNTYTFHTSLEESEIPPLGALIDRCILRWIPRCYQHTLVTRNKAAKGSLEKREECSFPEKIKTVKSVKVGDKTFVKAMIMKSFGQEITHPVVVMLQKNLPVKGHYA